MWTFTIRAIMNSLPRPPPMTPTSHSWNNMSYISFLTQPSCTIHSSVKHLLEFVLNMYQYCFFVVHRVPWFHAGPSLSLLVDVHSFEDELPELELCSRFQQRELMSFCLSMTFLHRLTYDYVFPDLVGVTIKCEWALWKTSRGSYTYQIIIEAIRRHSYSADSKYFNCVRCIIKFELGI